MTYQSRAEMIVALRREGMTLQQIGDLFDLTRERVRQILADEGVTGRPWTGFKPVHYARMAQAVARAATLIVQTAKPGDEHFPHGTVRGYMRGCSCGECRAANRERVYAYKGIEVRTPRPDMQVARSDGSQRAINYYGGLPE